MESKIKTMMNSESKFLWADLLQWSRNWNQLSHSQNEAFAVVKLLWQSKCLCHNVRFEGKKKEELERKLFSFKKLIDRSGKHTKGI